MKICYFGDYDPDYSRNKIIIKGLKQNGVEVVECRTEIRGRSFKKLLELYKRHQRLKGDYDLMIVGYSDSRAMVPLAKIISSRTIVWDAFYSLYDSWVYDRGLAKKNSFKAKYYYLLDKLSCYLSDKILLDTDEHIKYFVETFKINKVKFVKVLVGSIADLEVCEKTKSNAVDKKFKVFFYGKYIPLQGVEYIVRAAKILENESDIEFDILGSGQDSQRVKKIFNKLQIQNINFIDRVSYEELILKMSKADICLGIFGETDKAQRVIPNKIYDAIALGKPVITSDTPAIKELFIDRENILLCHIADENDLSLKILELKKDLHLRKKIAINSYDLFQKKCQSKRIAKRLIESLSV